MALPHLYISFGIMKKKLRLLVAGFIVFYYIVHIAYGLPDLVHGPSQLKLLPHSQEPLLFSIFDVASASLFVIGPYLILYRYYARGRWLLSVLLILAAIGIAFIINYRISKDFADAYYTRMRIFFNSNFFFFCVYILYGITFFFIRFAWYKEVQQKELLLQNRQSELSFLRSQINPHFLFNSLSNIYTLVYEGSAQALPAIAGFSELLRYMLYDNKEKVPLDKEIEYMRKYIALQKLRFEHAIVADLHVNGNTANVQIPPLLLVPFIENAFKHGDFSINGQGLTALVRCADDKMYFYCFNTKGKGEKDSGGGIGLPNIKRRLQLLYPGKHKLEILDNKDSFTVNMELQYA